MVLREGFWQCLEILVQADTSCKTPAPRPYPAKSTVQLKGLQLQLYGEPAQQAAQFTKVLTIAEAITIDTLKILKIATKRKV